MSEVYVVDAHAFARYLINDLPRGADAVLKDAEEQKCEIFIPAIAMAELIHIFERTGSELRIWEMFDKIDLYPSFSIYPLNDRVLKIIPDVKLSELHDRIIVGTCMALKADGLITKDKEIRKSGLVKTVW